MLNRIVVDPQIHFGQPCGAGTRITVHSILELIQEGISFSEIIEDYFPDLTLEDIQASVQYAIYMVANEDIHIATTAA